MNLFVVGSESGAPASSLDEQMLDWLVTSFRRGLFPRGVLLWFSRSLGIYCIVLSMTVSRRCDFLGRFRHVMHLYGICGRNMLLALYGRACCMLVGKNGCAFSVFFVAALLFPLESRSN